MIPEVSVIVPVYNEEESVGPLVEAVCAALGEAPRWELVFVDDGSTDGTVAAIGDASARDARVRVVRLARNYGQTAAMQAGFDNSLGDIVVSMDGDLQNDPQDIPLLVNKMSEGYDLVAGYRVRRQDAVIRRKIPSWVANRLIRFLTGVKIRDNGCSLKAYSRATLDRMHLYADMHRFIPAVAAATAGAQIAEIPVRHHARKFGESKYGLTRIAKVLADLLTITMIRSFRERPLALFAAGALVSGLLATVFVAASVNVLLGFGVERAASVVYPGAAVLWLGLAGYLLMLGLVAEVALWKSRRRRAEPSPLVHGDSANELRSPPTRPQPSTS